MNKRGFTLIEIIISITLIVGIGSIFLIFKFKNGSNDSQYEKIKSKLIDAASVYLSVEKDENGYTYENGLFNGGTAVFIPVNDLYEKGYISKDVLKTLEKNENYNNSVKKYLLASIFNDTNEECNGDSVIAYKNSWDNELDNTTYLCPVSKGGGTPEKSLNKILDDNEIQTQLACSTPGLAVDMDNDGATFYFRGNVNNNYIEYGEDKLGNKLLWRIVRVNGDGSLRLILDKNIDYYLMDSDNNKFKVSNNSNVSRIYPQYSPTTTYDKRPKNGVVFYDFKLKTKVVDDDYEYYYTYGKILNLTEYKFKIYPDIVMNYDTAISSLTKSLFDTNNLYNMILNNWLNNDVNLGTLYNGQFCNSLYKFDRFDDGDEYKYLINNNFKCDNNIVTRDWYDTSGTNSLLNSNIGFLSYGEREMSKCNGNSFLTMDTYLLSDKYNDGYYTNYNYDYEYYTSTGTVALSSASDPLKSNGRPCNDCYRYIYYDNTITNYYSAHGRDNGRRQSKITLINIRPVINLDKDIKLSGSGTQSAPYKIVN